MGAVQPDSPPAAGETIGERLKRLRLERGLSQRELAAPGVSYAYISRIEAGTRQPSVKALRRLASKLGVSADYLERGSDLDPASERELRLADLELAVRLGESTGVEDSLAGVIDEALKAGDLPAARRARVALASLTLDRGEYDRAIALLEASLVGEPFLPVERFDLYSSLGHAYALSGRPDRAVALFQECLTEVEDSGHNASVEARYATLLSYALTDVGDIGRAEDVIGRALDRIRETSDPYMRVRLYWSMARLAHQEGRESVALENVRKAIALLQATDDTFHLARAHILAAGIMVGREDARAAEEHIRSAETLLGPAPTPQDRFELTHHRSRIALLRGDAADAVEHARLALELSRNESPIDEGLAEFALADALALSGDSAAADEAYAHCVDQLEAVGRLRSASSACRAWGRLLRQNGDDRALDVLDRAADLGMRAVPQAAHADH
jgi:transcriptional regulator with XRE-family HTH domain